MPINDLPSAKPFTVAIIGGGFGGVALAIGLAKYNVPFHIYEAAPDFSEIGLGVAFGVNAVRALGLLSPQVSAAFDRHAATNEVPEMSGTFLTMRRGKAEGDAGKVGEMFFHLGENHPRHCVHRGAFLDDLVKLLPKGSTSFGKALVKVEDVDGSEEAEGEDKLLRFTDGSTATATVVVGCDGIGSKTRAYVHGPDAKPAFSGGYSYRAMVPRAVADRVLSPDIVVNGQLYAGSGAYITQYPVARGELVNMGLHLCRPPGENNAWVHDKWVVPGCREEMLADFAGWHPQICQLFAEYSAGEKWGLFDYQHSQSYVKGHVCLLGDAAHASTPHMGAGAGMAFEDAVVLSGLLGKAKSLEDVDERLGQYDAVRRPRTQELVRLSRLNGLTLAFAEEGIEDDLQLLERAITERFHWVWDSNFESVLSY